MKALASDLDGTLVHNWKISTEDLQAIASFQKEGNLFGICTGRGAHMCPETEQFRCDFVIASSGAHVLISGETVYERTIDYTDVKRIFEDYRQYCFMVIVQTEDAGNVYGYRMDFLKPFNEIEELKDSTFFDISLIFADEESTIKVHNEMKKHFSHLALHRNASSIDIVNPDCSKGNAVKFLKERMNIDTMAGIGDSYNDITMLRDADLGFTFPGSPEEVKDSADVLVSSVADAVMHLMKDE